MRIRAWSRRMENFFGLDLIRSGCTVVHQNIKDPHHSGCSFPSSSPARKAGWPITEAPLFARGWGGLGQDSGAKTTPRGPCRTRKKDGPSFFLAFFIHRRVNTVHYFRRFGIDLFFFIYSFIVIFYFYFILLNFIFCICFHHKVSQERKRKREREPPSFTSRGRRQPGRC